MMMLHHEGAIDQGGSTERSIRFVGRGRDDMYISFDGVDATGIANQAQADLFVSVHANYSDLPSARGVETYYTNFFSSPNAKDLEIRDQDRSQSAISAVLSPTELHDKIEQSRRLAASVQRYYPVKKGAPLSAFAECATRMPVFELVKDRI